MPAADRLKAVFDLAAEAPDLAARAAVLDRECGGDPALRDRVEALLRAHDAAGTFLAHPPAAVPDETAGYVPGDGATSDRSAAGEGPGAVIGPYKLLEEIGEGGFGVVYLAEQQEPVRRKVALKVLKPGMDSRTVVARFEAERQALALMDHPHIAKVFDGGTTPAGRPFFVMELVKGVPITEFCDANHLTPRQRLELFVPVCQAVQHAHQKAVIHRDLKPSNVLVSRYDSTPVVKVIDFGVAKALGQALTDKTLFTGVAQMVGTPLYMSPEQAGMSDLDVDTRSDIYSLGVLLYELLTGSTPFTADRFRRAAYDEIRRIIREEEPPRPSTRLSESRDMLPSVAAQRQTEPARLTRLIRGDLDWIVMKALEKDRARRYETASGFAADVQRYLADELVLACPPSAGYRLRKFARKHRRALVTAGAFLVLLAAGAVVSAWQAVVATRARADLAAKNAALADEQAKVQARFDLAVKAIETFHTGVGEDLLLKNPEFQELRTKLLKEAAGFYAELENLLAGQTDPKSRKLLADCYIQLSELTGTIGDYREAMTVLRKGMALQRELAAAPGAAVDTRLGMANSLRTEAMMLFYLRDLPGMLRACEELRQLAVALEEEAASNPVRAVVARSHHSIGALLFRIGKHEEALPAFQKAIAVGQKLADANPDVAEYQYGLARSQIEIGLLRMHTGRPEEALTALRMGSVIWQKLAAAYRADIRFQFGLANAHDYTAWCLLNMGRPAEAEAAEHKGLDLVQKLVDDYPADNLFQNKLANFQMNLGRALDRQKRLDEAFPALEKGVDILQKLAKAHPDAAVHTREFGESHAFRGGARARAGQPAEAAADLRRALELWAKLPSLDIEIQVERARALALLAGLSADAKSGVTKEEAGAFADQSVVVLAAAIKTGWALPSELREPDFDAVRGRADFQELFAEVEAKAEKVPETAPPPREKK